MVRIVTRDGALTTVSICCERLSTSCRILLNSGRSALYAVIVSYGLFREVSQAHVAFKYVELSSLTTI